MTRTPTITLRMLALAASLLACRAAEPTSTPPPSPPLADRGVVHTTEGVRITSRWRSTAAPRGVVIVFAEDAALAARILDAGFNYTIVGSAHIPLATRIAVAAAIANDKSLAHRQRLEQGRARRPAVTVLWFDESDGADALAALRAQPPFRVHAAVVLTREGPPRRHALASDSAGELRVLELPAPVDATAWADVLRFVDGHR